MQFDGIHSEQRGLRPGVVFQNNVGNLHSPNTIALPITSSIKNKNLPTHVFLKATETGLHMDSVVLCESPERMAKEKLSRYIATLSKDYMKRITEASLLATSAISFLDEVTLLRIWQTAVALNTAQ